MTTVIPMTVELARGLLSDPKFGDPKHIEAVRLLELLSEAIDLNDKKDDFDLDCDDCHGTGECGHECSSCGAHQCGACGGSGSIMNHGQVESLTAGDLSRIIDVLRKDQRSSA